MDVDLMTTSVNTTKKTIFLAAAELFAEKGYAGVSMKDIANKACITAASIYNHYKSKQQIMDALLEHYLERMEYFYVRLSDAKFDLSDGLNSVLNQLMLAYEDHEKLLMYYLTRIVHHEQFNYQSAAEALIGSGYKKYVDAHSHFFDRLAQAGLISGKVDSSRYGEIYARLSLTFATQFLHPEVEHTIGEQSELSDFVNKLVINYEEQLMQQG